MNRIICLLVVLLFVGCGSRTDFVPSVPDNTAPTGAIQVDHQLARAVPLFVTEISYSGLDSEGVVIYGPEVRAKSPQTLLEGVPTSVTTLRIEYLNKSRVIGRFETPITVIAFTITTISDPAWLDVQPVPPSFSQGESLETGRGPTGVATGDFDNDGREDLVVTNSLDDGISIFLGQGDGSFGEPSNMATGPVAFNVMVGDLNGDNNLDLVVTNYGNSPDTGDISVLLGNGDGTFTAAPSLLAQNQPIATAIADFNGDGQNDLAICNYESSSISIFLGNGDGTFSDPEHITVGPRPHDIIAADFNKDGRSDLLVSNEGLGMGGGNVCTLLGNGDGTFADPNFFSTGRNPRNAAVADVDGDGNLDVITGNFTDASISVLLGRGDGTLGPNQDFETGGVPLSIIVGDFNDDGRPDVAAAASGLDQVLVLSGLGDGSFSSPIGFEAGQGAIYLDKGDFNRDGRLDIAVVGFGSLQGVGNLRVLLGQ